jgi:hypothetical protein
VRDRLAHAVFESVSNRFEGGLYDGKFVRQTTGWQAAKARQFLSTIGGCDSTFCRREVAGAAHQ